MDYKGKIIEILSGIENQKYLEYIYILLKSFLES